MNKKVLIGLSVAAAIIAFAYVGYKSLLENEEINCDDEYDDMDMCKYDRYDGTILSNRLW